MLAFDDPKRLAKLNCLAVSDGTQSDAKVSLVVEIDGRYYEFQPTAPAFTPVRPHCTLTVQTGSAACAKLLEVSSGSQAKGLKESALDLLAFRLCTDHRVCFQDEEDLFLKSVHATSGCKGFFLYKAKRAFTEAWCEIEELIS